MDGLEAHDGARQEKPYVFCESLSYCSEKVLASGVAATGDEDDDPEEGCAGLVALIGIPLAHNGDEGVKALEVSVHDLAIVFATAVI